MGKQNISRTRVLFGFVALVAGLIAWRLFVLSVDDHAFYAQVAQAQDQNTSNLLVRGNIYIQDPKAGNASNNEFVVATDKKFPYAYIDPAKITNSAEVSNQIQSILGIDPQTLADVINSKADITKVIEHRITADQAAKIISLDLPGLGVQYEMERYYPAGDMLSTVLGFYGFNSQGQAAGQYGVEAYYNNELSGEISGPTNSGPNDHGVLAAIKNFVSSGSVSNSATPQPADLVLTIDRNIQSFIENELKNTIQKWNAPSGTIIVQDPQTGKILGMADWPNFDPNNYSSFPTADYLNQSTQAIFEPGSSFKTITMAAGVDLNKVTPDTIYTDPGVINIGGFKIYNFDNKSHGTVDMTTVLEESLNTGAAFVEGLVGQDDFRNYVVNFGFGQKTDVDLPGELGGSISNLYSGSQTDFVTASFGQGISATPLQVIDAYSAIANGGKVMKPYVVDKIMYADGQVQQTKPQVVSIPITQKTSATMREMLVNDVDHGFDAARVPGYSVAGKTGTAQVASPNGGYEPGVYINDFLGFAPASNPKFTILVKLDQPKGAIYASNTLTPVFRDVAKYLIDYYNIPPDRPTSTP